MTPPFLRTRFDVISPSQKWNAPVPRAICSGYPEVRRIQRKLMRLSELQFRGRDWHEPCNTGGHNQRKP
jgi:hypothetical protein